MNFERQYIGARYVPILGGAWDINKSYEALTIVQANNSSYTSKKPVQPGIDIHNTEYWVLTGNFNGQIEEYRQQVVVLEKEIEGAKKDSLNYKKASTIFGKKIAIFGDSISDENNDFSWVHTFREKYGKVCTINNYSESGIIMSEVAARIEMVSDKTADIIIVFAGTNDWARNTNIVDYTSGFGNAVREVYTKLTGWKNSDGGRSKVFFVTPLTRTGGENRNEVGFPLYYYNKVIEGYCNSYGLPVIDGRNAPMQCEWSAQHQDIYKDGLHPTIWYSKILSDYIVGSITDGNCVTRIRPNISRSFADKFANGVTGDARVYFEGTSMHVVAKFVVTPDSSNIPLTTAMPEMSADVSGIDWYSPVGIFTGGLSKQGFIYQENNVVRCNADPSVAGNECVIYANFSFAPKWCNQN